MRVALGIEYEGTNYFGFQRQNSKITVQGELERALSVIANAPIEIQCAGRTDAGVNATGQVIHFDVEAQRSERSWVLGTNTHLPCDIAVTWAKFVDHGFHARFSARARRYRYIIQNTLNRPGIHSKGVSVYNRQYDLKKMQLCASLLIGEHDFASFCGADEESKSTSRCVHYLEISRHGPFIVFDIAANAFLNHMVRNIVGSLLLVGDGSCDYEWFKAAFLSCMRSKAGPTAKPDGLYLVDVTYPSEFNLPKRNYIGPLWLP